MSGSMSCTYNRDTLELTITSPVTALVQDLEMKFRVGSFKNPFSVRPREGFIILSKDPVTGLTYEKSELTLTAT